MIVSYSTFISDNDVDVVFQPETGMERALLRAISTRKLVICREGSLMKLRFKEGK